MDEITREIKVLQGMIRDGMGGRGSTMPASRPQVLAIILAFKQIEDIDRDERLAALNALRPPEWPHVASTNQLDLTTANILIGWLYGLAPTDSLEPDMALAPYAQKVLERLAHVQTA